MAPVWEKYPDIPRGSIGWRMGRGEEYYDEFYRWFSNLDAVGQSNYILAHPEPVEWKGFYTTIINHPWRLN